MSDRILTIEQAGLLGDLIHGVERGLKLRYYPRGSDDAERPMTLVMRAFTREDGSLYPHDKDIRDSFVWFSSMFEHWIKVDKLIEAIDNAVTGKYGADKPMAIIDKE